MLWGENNSRKTNRASDKKKWKWIGHTVWKDPNAVGRIMLDWNPQGTRK
jgi:hypothetical protein